MIRFAIGALFGFFGIGLLYITLAMLLRMRGNYTDADPFYAAFLAEHWARWFEHTIAAILIGFELPAYWFIKKGRTL